MTEPAAEPQPTALQYAVQEFSSLKVESKRVARKGMLLCVGILAFILLLPFNLYWMVRFYIAFGEAGNAFIGSFWGE